MKRGGAVERWPSMCTSVTEAVDTFDRGAEGYAAAALPRKKGCPSSQSGCTIVAKRSLDFSWIFHHPRGFFDFVEILQQKRRR